MFVEDPVIVLDELAVVFPLWNGNAAGASRIAGKGDFAFEKSNMSLFLEPSKAVTFCASAETLCRTDGAPRMKKEFASYEKLLSRTAMK